LRRASASLTSPPLSVSIGGFTSSGFLPSPEGTQVARTN
jgi:hypothetical protein